ncbi:MAG: cobalt-zinc-cadmium efflux system protein [Alphaproteobacteria bacterium]|jgi:cobalt-zinc-cadmium efflux system protein|nr:cobalt-zinc-cadmium efflux system protein [Alphaproteobacteria bacterium]
MTHEHNSRGLGHVHAPRNFGITFAAAAALNIALVVIQVVYGIFAHSIALLADAGHNAGDGLGLVLAWGAHMLARRLPTERYTYGLRSASIMAALLNAVILLVVTGAIAVEALHRFFEPQPVAALPVIIVSAMAIGLNGLAAWMLMEGHRDLNIRGAFLHMVADAGVSLGVVLAGGAILLTGWLWIDPAMSLVVSAVIIWGTWDLLRRSVTMSLQAVPQEIEPGKVRGYLETLPGVTAVHDLHIWAMSTTETALTCHLVVPTGHPGDEFLDQVCHELHHRFEIAHPTLQIEMGETECKLAPTHVI